MPAAITSDLQQQQLRFGSMIRLIQQARLGPVHADDEPIPSNDSPGYEELEPPVLHEIDEELNRSAVAPVRWV